MTSDLVVTVRTSLDSLLLLGMRAAEIAIACERPKLASVVTADVGGPQSSFEADCAEAVEQRGESLNWDASGYCRRLAPSPS